MDECQAAPCELAYAAHKSPCLGSLKTCEPTTLDKDVHLGEPPDTADGTM